MRYIKIILFLAVSMSFLFPHHGRRKAWKHKKRHHIRKVHKKPKFNIRLGYNYIWPTWRWNYQWCHRHNNRDVVVVHNSNGSNKEESYSVDEIIAQIEKLAVLKEKGIISEKEYEKKKKDLLKRI
jgi:hypothetical protein|tara:strand:+ start:702 stop:1076 length:375 start_codon:yes stop_codon:yes gene_type:complete